jgi:hypothetical protein
MHRVLCGYQSLVADLQIPEVDNILAAGPQRLDKLTLVLQPAGEEGLKKRIVPDRSFVSPANLRELKRRPVTAVQEV